VQRPFEPITGEVRPPSAIPAPLLPAQRRSPIRLHATLLVLTFFTTALAGGLWWEQGAADALSGHGWIDPAFLWGTVVRGLAYGFWVIVILGCHEMGHYLACRAYGIPATLPYFLPGIPPIGSFGAVIRIRGPIPDRRALFDVAAAGPIAGFLVTAPVLLLGTLRAEPFPLSEVEGAEAIYLGRPVLLVLFDALAGHGADVEVNSLIGAGWVGLLVTSLNLFPAGQLDGGHVAYALSRRTHALLARATLVGLAGVILAQVLLYRQFPAYVIWFAILLWMRDRHPRLLDESTELGPGRKVAACMLLLIFALSFIFVPIYME
jgi:membrane-associated protease RseP (regulator of RpoE activity)